MSSHETPTESLPVAKSRLQERIWRLVAWYAAVAVLLGLFWHWIGYQDYRNTGVVVAVVLAFFGTSAWVLRNVGGTARRRRLLALLVWAPLWIVSPIGPVQLVHNGNVGIETWRWRWSLRPDELLSTNEGRGGVIDLVTTPHDYPAFLGGGYWAEVKGTQLDPDWAAHPPKNVWRQPIGAGWSSFAIVGVYAFTQEQRGPQEMVACYDLRTGQVAWTHGDDVRWDPGGSGALGRIGPRATPSVADGCVYTQGATGVVNCLDASTGRRIWSHDTLAEESSEVVMWGKAGSPLLLDDWVVVSVGGSDGRSLVAYDRATGRKAWRAGSRQSSYATPVLATLAGERQIVVVNEDYVTSHRAGDGQVLWEHQWAGSSNSNASASQPVPVGDDRVLLTKGYSVPAELIKVSRDSDGGWSTQTLWRKPVLRTKFSNVLVRDGYVYAIDDVDLVCVELATGRRKWKSRRRPAVGDGQILLAGDYIIVSCESGEVLLVEVNPHKYVEKGAFQAIEGVTWNNPALSRNLLLLRNSEEAACFELPIKEAVSDAAKLSAISDQRSAGK